MWAQDSALCCQVQDGTPPGAGPGEEAGADAEWPPAHGHGLWLARQVADQLRLESRPAGTRATAIFALR